MKGQLFMEYNLDFNAEQYKTETITVEGQTISYRAFENLVYVKHPVNTDYQIMNLYVPEIYYEGKSIGSFDLKTAPIFLPNMVGGYMPGEPDCPGLHPYTHKLNAAFVAIQKGYIVAAPGIRGNYLTNEEGRYTSVAPACITDYKAAVRYLRYNKDRIPGNLEKIISNGTSAGGALSSLLGVTGNHPDYDPYLKEIGAAEERDDIFAASCYCPITNLDHADMAYEWEFHGHEDYHRMKFEMKDGKPNLTPIDGVMTELQKELSERLKVLFPEYLNSLHLLSPDRRKLELDANGNGTFKNYVLQLLMESAQTALSRGEDLSKIDWLVIQDGRVVAADFDRYVAFATRMKEAPAFDNVELNTPENALFGSPEIKHRHFTAFSHEHSSMNGSMAEEVQIKLMNPMNYIASEECKTAGHFRIRHGAIDRDTSIAIPVILKTKLQNNGISVDFHLPWGEPHAGDYDLTELFEWMDKICNK
jgi:hypothetical protein